MTDDIQAQLQRDTRLGWVRRHLPGGYVAKHNLNQDGFLVGHELQLHDGTLIGNVVNVHERMVEYLRSRKLDARDFFAFMAEGLVSVEQVSEWAGGSKGGES